MAGPLISVIIPTRDRPDKLVQAIESVTSQTYEPYEIIVVDDGSRVDVGNVLNRLYSDRITFVRHETALGACAARNSGLLHAKGDFIAFLDDDDRWLPQKLEKQMARFVEPGGENLALVGCGYYYESDGSIVDTRYAQNPSAPFDNLLIANWIGGSSLPLLRKNMLDRVGHFDTSFQSCQDWDLWIRLSRDFEISVVEAPLVFRVIHQAQISGDLERKIEGRKSLLVKHRHELDARPAALTAHLRRLGTLVLLAGNAVSARGYYRRALKVSPIDLRSWAGLFISWLPGPIRKGILDSFAPEHIGGQALYY